MKEASISAFETRSRRTLRFAVPRWPRDLTPPRGKHADRRSRHSGGRKPSKTVSHLVSANSPTTALREAMSLIIAMIGTAATPLIMALQISALTGSREVKLTPRPAKRACRSRRCLSKYREGKASCDGTEGLCRLG